MTQLKNYGWSNFQEEHYKKQTNNLPVGRIISVKGYRYLLITEKGELETELSGKLLYGTDPENLPKVGDWVFYMDYESIGYIIDLFPRVNALSRKTPGNKIEKQVLAANVDHALIVQGLDRDFNMMRLERYRVQITACGIHPIVILNKSDLVDNPESKRLEVKTSLNCEVYCCSTYTRSGLDLIGNIFQPNKTYILIGSSGVGKSSLLNALATTDLQKTGSTSDSTSKGKHTTTTRDLFQLSNGSLIIDTPGMREFGVTFEEGADSSAMFPEIEKFATHCRFPDCTHTNDPGCAVVDALSKGNLDRLVYDSFIKLMKEQRRFQIKIEDKKRIEKQFGKITREAKNHRRKFKY